TTCKTRTSVSFECACAITACTAALENLESSIGSNIFMRVTFPVFPGATRAKPTTRRLLAGSGEQRRRQKTGPVLDSETYLATCIVRRYILEEVLRACCSLSHTFADLGFPPAATRMIDRDDEHGGVFDIA